MLTNDFDRGIRKVDLHISSQKEYNKTFDYEVMDDINKLPKRVNFDDSISPTSLMQQNLKTYVLESKSTKQEKMTRFKNIINFISELDCPQLKSPGHKKLHRKESLIYLEREHDQFSNIGSVNFSMTKSNHSISSEEYLMAEEKKEKQINNMMAGALKVWFKKKVHKEKAHKMRIVNNFKTTKR